MLTNPTYMGHWCVKDAVVVWNNHPAIISEDVFDRAFNYLSAYGLDGEKESRLSPYPTAHTPNA